MNIRDQIAEKVSSFPTLPVIAHKLTAIAGSGDADAGQIGEVLRYDPALTANVLKAANSAFLGFSEPVDSVTEAIFRMGTNWVFQTALSSLIYSNLKRPAEGYGLSAEELWKHSAAVALMSDNLRKLLSIKEAGATFTAALLHDIGKIALARYVGESFDEIQAEVESHDYSFERAERAIITIDHAEAGALVAENWGFSEHVVRAIRYHHDPDEAEEPSQLTDVVHIADAVCLMQGIGIGVDGLWYRPSDESIDRLGVTSVILEKATSQMIVSLEAMENMFCQSPEMVTEGR